MEDPTDWKHIPALDDIPSYTVYTKPLQKGDLDDREYRILKLENGLQVILVHDPKADKSAASLDISVGHLRDPDDIPGLAHFCEHMLFLGTEKYPRENEYKEYLTKNGGYSNAGTGTDYTNYYFRVNASALPGALDRFAAFFTCPLFTPSCTLREMNAVDSENKKNLQDDSRRLFQLGKHLSKPGHVWRKFGTGNKKTLMHAAEKLVGAGKVDGNDKEDGGEEDGGPAGREARRRLIEWYSKEYCASRMSLAVVGKEPLDELTPLIAKLFTPVLNRGQDPRPKISDHPYGENELGSIAFVKSVKDVKRLELCFPFPDARPMWRTKPYSVISAILGHEGPGSVFSYLKSKGWITSQSAGVSPMAHEIAVIEISIRLTDEGFKHYRDILLVIFKFINLYRSSPPSDGLYAEIQAIDALRFRFREKSSPDSYAKSLTKCLKHTTPRELVLSGPSLTFDRNNEEAKELLQLLDVEKCRVMLVARDHFDVGEHADWTKEPWYGTEYVMRKLEEEFMSEAHKPNDIPALHAPSPNEYIPKNLDVDKCDTDTPEKSPTLVARTDVMEVWHKKDDQFWVPKGAFTMDLRSPVAFVSPRSSVLTRLYTELVEDALEELVYAASLAGLNYSIDSRLVGVKLAVLGFNDKLVLLLQTVLETMKNLQVRTERLEVIKEKVRRSWENFYFNTPYYVSDHAAALVITEYMHDYKEYLKELPTISVEEMGEFARQFFAQMFVRVLIVGNMYQEDATRIADMITVTLDTKPMPEGERPHYLSRLLPPGCNYIWEIQNEDPKQINGSVSYFLHLGDIAIPRARVTAYLLINILREPTFSTLRTKEQLGYIVSITDWDDTGYVGLRIVVQSRKDTKFVEWRIENFLEDMRSTIREMSDEQIDERKAGLIQDWTQKLKNLKEESNRFWGHIASGYLDFRRKYNDAELLRTITKQEIVDCFERYVDPASTSRSKFSVHLRPQTSQPDDRAEEGQEHLSDKVVFVTGDINEFKAKLQLSGPSTPVESLDGGFVAKF